MAKQGNQTHRAAPGGRPVAVGEAGRRGSCQFASVVVFVRKQQTLAQSRAPTARRLIGLGI